MDHEVVVREKMTEKYLLEELGPALREQFEEHFFECPECARDVRAASEFVALSKDVLAEEPRTVKAHADAGVPEGARGAGSGGWLGWLRPAFAIPALAVLLAVIGYQNLVMLPRLEQSANQPRVLPAATVNLLTYGATASPLPVHEGEGFLLNVIVPPGHRYAAYRVDLYNPAGKLEASVPIAGSAVDETWPIQFPSASRQSGTYKLTVHGENSSGKDEEIGSGSFELQVQK